MKTLSVTKPYVSRVVGRSGVAALAAVALLCFSGTAHPYASMMPGTKHDFIQYGSNAGGTCDVCHAAGGGASDGTRLYRWDSSYYGADKCAGTCHSVAGYPDKPANETDTLDTMVGAPTPPLYPHRGPAVVLCSVCHDSRVDYRDCLTCHTPTTFGSEQAFGQSPGGHDAGTLANPVDTEVDKFFAGIGSVPSPSGILSQHDIVYNSSGDLTNPAQNECLKCHGKGSWKLHPGLVEDRPLLVYADDPDGSGPLVADMGLIDDESPTYLANVVNYGIIPANQTAAYMGGGSPSGAEWDSYYQAKRQYFCLACHDGEDDAGTGNTGFNGENVPAVPPTDSNTGPLQGFSSQPPYFADHTNAPSEEAYPTDNYFEKNGHGIDSGIEGTAMNMTCLGEEVPDDESGSGSASTSVGLGCHSVHGSANYFLLRDAGSDGSVDLGTGVSTADELGTLVCMGCHTRTIMTDDYNANLFHLWLGPTRMLHIDLQGDVARDDTIVYWEPLTAGNNMNTGDSGLQTGVLPFFTGHDADLISGRTYTPAYGSGVTAYDGAAVTCVTCHDPHGTSHEYTSYTDNAPNTMGMLRIPYRDVDFTDPLCSECHVP